MRRVAKVMNFGVIYGLSAFGISQQTDLAPDQGAKVHRELLLQVPGHSDIPGGTPRRRPGSSGYLETVCGRRRYFPEMGSSNFHIRQAAERMAVNMPIQGTAADVIKLAMV